MSSIIKSLRTQFPQYEDLSDDELVKGVHKTFYSDIPQEEFNNKIGYSQESPGFLKALSAGVDVLQQAGGGVLAGAGKAIGSETIEEYGRDIVTHNEQQIYENLAGATDWRDIDSVGKFKDYAAETFGLNSPQMATILAAGAFSAKYAPTKLPIIGPLSKPLAFAGGAAGASIPMFFGMNVSRQIEEDKEISPGKAAAAAVGQGIAEGIFASVLGPSSRMLGIKLSPNMGARMIQKISGAIATGVPGEVVQQGLERWASDLPVGIDDEQALEEYFDAGIGATLLAGGFGGLSAIPKPKKTMEEQSEEFYKGIKKEGEGIDAITDEVDGKPVEAPVTPVEEVVEEPAVEPTTVEPILKTPKEEREEDRELLYNLRKEVEQPIYRKKKEVTPTKEVKPETKIEEEEELTDWEALAKYDATRDIITEPVVEPTVEPEVIPQQPLTEDKVRRLKILDKQGRNSLVDKVARVNSIKLSDAPNLEQSNSFLSGDLDTRIGFVERYKEVVEPNKPYAETLRKKAKSKGKKLTPDNKAKLSKLADLYDPKVVKAPKLQKVTPTALNLSEPTTLKTINLSPKARGALKPAIERITKNIQKIAGVKAEFNPVEHLEALGDKTKPITLRGAQQGNVLYTAMGSVNETFAKQNETAMHETYHFLRDELGVFTDGEKRTLDREAPRIRKFLNQEYGIHSSDLDRLGAGPEGQRELEATAFGLYAQGKTKNIGKVKKIFDKVLKILKGIREAFGVQGISKFEDIFDSVLDGEKAQLANDIALQEGVETRYQKLQDESDKYKNSLDKQIADFKPTFEKTDASDIQDLSMGSNSFLSIPQIARHHPFFAKMFNIFNGKQHDEGNIQKDVFRRLSPILKHKNFPDISKALSHMRDTDQSIITDEQGRIVYIDENNSKRTLNAEASQVLKDYDGAYKHVLDLYSIYTRDRLEGIGVNPGITLPQLKKVIDNYSKNVPLAKQRLKKITPLTERLNKVGIDTSKSTVDIQREIFARRKQKDIGKGDANYILRTIKDINEFSDFVGVDRTKATLDDYQGAFKKFVDTITDSMQAEGVQKRVNKLNTIYSNLAEIDEIKTNNKAYMPRMRFGRRGIVVHDKTKPKGDDDRLVALFTLEENIKGNVNKGQYKKALADIKSKYSDTSKFEVYGDKKPFLLTKENLLKKVTPRHITIELMASILNSNVDQDVVKKITEELRKSAGAYGMQKNLLPAKNIDGYSTDWERNAIAYFSALPGYLTNLKYSDILEKMDSEIDTVSDWNSKTQKFARDYYDYVTLPNQDQMKLRMFNFFWTMAPNLSTALLQFATIPTTTASEMIQWNGNVLKNNYTLAKNLARTGKIMHKSATFDLNDSLDIGAEGALDGLGFNESEKKFLRKGFQRGQLQASLSEDWGAGPSRATEGAGGKVYRAMAKGLRIASAPISMAEMWSRMTSGLSFLDSLSHSDGSVNSKAVNRALEAYKNDKRFKMLLEELGDSPSLDSLRETIALYAIDNVHAIFGKAGRGRAQRGWWGSMIFPFMTHPIQVMENFLEQASNRGKRGRAAALYQLSTFLFIGGLMGLPASELWKEAYEVWQRMQGKEADLILDMREAMFTQFTEEFGMDDESARNLALFVTNGFSRTNLDIDVSRRLSYPIFFQNHLVNAMKAVSGGTVDPHQMLGVVGGVIRGGSTGIKQIQEGENPFVALSTQFSPVAFSNFVKGGILYSTRGAQTASGKQLLTPEEITLGDKARQTIGFTPASKATRLEQMQFERISGTGASVGKTRYYSKISKVVEQRLKEQAKTSPDETKLTKLREQEVILRKKLARFALENNLRVDKKFWDGANRAIRQRVMQRRNPGKPTKKMRNVNYPLSKRLFKIEEE